MGWLKDAYEEGVEEGEEQAALLIAVIKGIKWLLYKCIGLYMLLPWLLGALFYAISIVGLPYAKVLLQNAFYTLKYPEYVWERVEIKTDFKVSPIANGIWRCTFGLLTALGYILFGVLLFMTLIGIPEGKIYFKMIKLGFTPFGVSFEKIEK